MQAGILLLVAIVLCASLLLRLLISHFFARSVFDRDSSLPLVPGIDDYLGKEESRREEAERRLKAVQKGKNFRIASGNPKTIEGKEETVKKH